MEATHTLIERNGNRYLPVLALENISKQVLEKAKELSKEKNIPLKDIGINLNQFHTTEISPMSHFDSQLVVREDEKEKELNNLMSEIKTRVAGDIALLDFIEYITHHVNNNRIAIEGIEKRTEELETGLYD